MRYYLSVDSGGTKTAFLLTDETGKAVLEYTASGCTYSVMGSEKVFQILKRGSEEALKRYGISPHDIKFATWGISCFGEYRQLDDYLSDFLPELFPASEGCYLCNDVEVALAGSLLMESGIHIIAGTGAIVMGKDKMGRTARANGWHEAFSDEGSAYRLGIKTLSLFVKQADLRENRGRLYDLFYKYLSLEKDMDIVGYYKEHLEGSRERIAALQKILMEAAEEGDTAAAKLYEEAAWELSESVKGVARQLDMQKEGVNVSYYGGVFKSGGLILGPLKQYLKKQGYQLVPPELSPASGGILIAADRCREAMDKIIGNLRAYESGKK